jgi:hypothetical protein
LEFKTHLKELRTRYVKAQGEAAANLKSFNDYKAALKQAGLENPDLGPDAIKALVAKNTELDLVVGAVAVTHGGKGHCVRFSGYPQPEPHG